MKAVVLSGVTPAGEIHLSEVKTPEAVPGWVVVKIKAFGLNHSEKILRLDEIRAEYIRKPVIPGIECAGEIADGSDTPLRPGRKVIAMMGGMGRSFDGSYAEYALLPAHHVFAVQTDMPWEELGALPETFFTAWGSLFEGLRLEAGDTLLVRGGTCALGYAAIQLAKALGCRVVATARREEKFASLRAAGVDECLCDGGEIAGQVRATKALELVGPKTLRDTLRCVERGGIVCDTGILGGVYRLDGFDPVKDIPNGAFLTGFFSNFPSRTAVDEMMAFIRAHGIQPRIGAVYPLPKIAEACAALDAGSADGKIVVTV